MRVPMLTVDAFADRAFAGNPAAVCLLEREAPEQWMRAVAREMNLSETAFVVPRPDGSFSLRWFTPAKEVNLCGHATLASAHALWSEGRLARERPAVFHTRSGKLACRPAPEGRIAMDFPANPAAPAAAPEGLWKALGIEPCPVLRNRSDYLLVATDAASLRACRPDFAALARLSDVHGFVLTAPGDGEGDGGPDYLCRYFVPAYGIDEDPVTGSIQTMLGPYWCARLGKAEVRGFQASSRGGSFTVRPDGARVTITGCAVTVARGELLAGPPGPSPVVAAAAAR